MRGMQRGRGRDVKILEGLEARRLFAGNVLVEQIGSVIRLTGDSAANDVNLTVAPGAGVFDVDIVGEPGTTITFGGVTDDAANLHAASPLFLEVRLGNGNDHIDILGSLGFDIHGL